MFQKLKAPAAYFALRKKEVEDFNLNQKKREIKEFDKMNEMLAKAKQKVSNQEFDDEEEDKRLSEEGRKFLSLMDNNWQEYYSADE